MTQGHVPFVWSFLKDFIYEIYIYTVSNLEDDVAKRGWFIFFNTERPLGWGCVREVASMGQMFLFLFENIIINLYIKSLFNFVSTHNCAFKQLF